MRKNYFYYPVSLLLLAAGAGVAVAYADLSERVAPSAQSPRSTVEVTPVKPTFAGEFAFDVQTSSSWIHLSVTAPSKGLDGNRKECDIDNIDRLEIYRFDDFNYEGDGKLVHSWSNVLPGMKLEFDDREPLEPRIEYTYRAVAVRHGVVGETAYTYVTYGINPTDPNPAVLTSREGGAPITVNFSCPEATVGDYWDPKPFPAGVEFTEIRLYKKSGGSEQVLFSDMDPVAGKSYEYVDSEATEGYNTYYLRAFTQFGYSSEVVSSMFLGKDYPGRVTNVEAVESGGNIVVTWDAPQEGYRGGYLDPATLSYRIYRLDNNFGQNPVLLAEDLKECRYVDDLADVKEEQMAYYRVYPYNDIETPAGTYNYGDSRVGIPAGPAAQLPFRETFNAGSKFNKKFDNSWEEDFGSYSFDSHYIRNDVNVETPTGSRDVTEGVDGPGTDETGADAFFYVKGGSFSNSTDPGYLTTSNVSLADARNPRLSVCYMPVAGSCARMDIQVSVGAVDDAGNPVFTDLQTVDFSRNPDGTEPDPSDPLAWRKMMADLSDYAGQPRVKVRFAFRFSDPKEARYEMLVDDIRMDDYPSVENLAVEYDGESKITLTWNLPESAGSKDVEYDVYLNGEKSATTSECSYVYDKAEQGESYAFGVTARYADGVDSPMTESEPLEVPLVDFTLDDFYYVVSDSGVSIQGYVGSATEITVPASVEYKGNTYNVCRLYSGLFKGNRALERIDIAAEIEDIPGNIFYGCVALEEVKIPSVVKRIGDHALFGCVALKSVDLPAGLQTIEASAFRNCTALSSVSFGAALERIGQNAFSGCRSLAKVSFASPEPPVVEKDAFADIADKCEGICPEGSVEKYVNAENMSEIHFLNAGVLLTESADVVAVEYISADGVRLVSPSVGEPVIVRVTYADGRVRTSRRIYKSQY